MAEAAYYDDLYRESRRLGAAAAATLTRRYGWLRGDVYAWPAGWIDIVERLCIGIAEALAATSVVDGFTVTQLKEKYGGLKVYCDPHHRAETTATDRRIAELVAAAEMESLMTCEICGRPGTAQWLDGRQERENATLCGEHLTAAERS